MQEAVALFRKTAYDPPVEVKLLIYQDALQMYDIRSLAYIDAIPLRQLDYITQDEETVTLHFRQTDDVKLILEDDHPLLPEIRKAEKKPLLSTGGKVFVLTVAVIATLLFLNYTFSSLVADIGLRIISPQYEAKLGDQMYHAAVPPTALDGKRTALIQSFARKLHLSDVYNIQVSVIHSEEVNAFAVPGGHIVVYSGLLEKMDDYDELVALLGHEASHINERHTTRAILKELSSKLFLIFLMDVTEVGAILLLNADRLRGLSYSRSLEREADEAGLKLMMRNRVNTQGMLKLFERLQEADSVATPALLNTHPLTSKRIAYTREQISKHPQTDVVVDPVLQELWVNLKNNTFPGEADIPEFED